MNADRELLAAIADALDVPLGHPDYHAELDRRVQWIRGTIEAGTGSALGTWDAAAFLRKQVGA